MARVAFPLVLQSPSSGSAIVGATATISQHVVGASLGSGPAASIYASETGAGSTGSNQITTDDTGRWTQGAGAAYAQYWLPEGTYDIVVSGSGLSAFTITRELASGASPQLVTALPANPYDGQKIAFLADATNGIVWHFRYRAASPSAFKWEYIGGTPLIAAYSLSAQTTSSGAFGDLATVGPTVTQPTLPNGGDFLVRVGAQITTAAVAGSAGQMSYVTPSGFGPSSGFQALVKGNAIAASAMTSVQHGNSGAATGSFTAKYAAQGGSPVTFENRWIEVTPIRVG